ncbi:MAG: hypothetical protein ACE3JK_04355 [Sporolactobacillus sp.]
MSEDLSKRRLIFLQELKKLRENGYFSPEVESKIHSIYEHYFSDQVRLTAQRSQINRTHPIPEQKKKAVRQTVQTKPATRPAPPIRPALTKEQIRERNLTLVLILGVVFLLLGGLIMATTHWGNFAAILKVLLILSISLVFAGMSLIARKLNIPRTSFAFLTLAALFLPIIILCASYYQLIGEYFSLRGPGITLLGFAASILLAFIYHQIARRYRAVWFEAFAVFLTYLALAFITYYMTQDTVYWMLLFNLTSLAGFLVLLRYHQKPSAQFLQFVVKYERIIGQIMVILNALLTLIFQSESLIYTLVYLLSACAFIYCLSRHFSPFHVIGYFSFYLLSFLQYTIHIQGHSAWIIGCTALIAFFILLQHFTVDQFESPLWITVHHWVNIGMILCLSQLFTLVRTVHWSETALNVLFLMAGFVLLLLLVKKNSQSMRYAVVVYLYLVINNLCQIFNASPAVEIRLLLILSLTHLFGFYLTRTIRKRLPSYTQASLISGSVVFAASFLYGLTFFSSFEQAFWGIIIWILLIRTSQFKTGKAQSIALWIRPFLLGLIVIRLLPFAKEAALILILANAAVLLEKWLFQRIKWPVAWPMSLYAAMTFCLGGLAAWCLQLSDPPAIIPLIVISYITCFAILLAVISKKRIWQIIQSLLSGITIGYLAYLLYFLGTPLTGIIL